MKNQLLEIRGLTVEYQTYRGFVKAISNVDLQIKEGEVVGVVGESGCGKSTIALSIMNLLPSNGRIIKGKILLKGDDLLAFSEEKMAKEIRGRKITMITQNPHTALNPVFRIREQMEEILRAFEPSKNDQGIPWRQRKASYHQRCIKALQEMEIADPSERINNYCLLYTSPSPRDLSTSRMPSSA